MRTRHVGVDHQVTGEYNFTIADDGLAGSIRFLAEINPATGRDMPWRYLIFSAVIGIPHRILHRLEKDGQCTMDG